MDFLLRGCFLDGFGHGGVALCSKGVDHVTNRLKLGEAEAGDGGGWLKRRRSRTSRRRSAALCENVGAGTGVGTGVGAVFRAMFRAVFRAVFRVWFRAWSSSPAVQLQQGQRNRSPNLVEVGDGVGQVEQVSVLVHGGGAGLADVAAGFDRVGVHHPEFFRDALETNKKIKQVNMMQCETILCFASNEWRSNDGKIPRTTTTLTTRPAPPLTPSGKCLPASSLIRFQSATASPSSFRCTVGWVGWQ